MLKSLIVGAPWSYCCYVCQCNELLLLFVAFEDTQKTNVMGLVLVVDV